MPKNTDIEKSKITLTYTRAFSILVTLALAVWALSAFVGSLKAADNAVDIKLQTQIDNINNRISKDSAIRDQRLKDFQRFYGKDTLRYH